MYSIRDIVIFDFIAVKKTYYTPINAANGEGNAFGKTSPAQVTAFFMLAKYIFDKTSSLLTKTGSESLGGDIAA